MVTLEQFRYCPTHSTHPPFCYDFHYVKPGMVAIFGDNGSGKSTLAQLMAGWYCACTFSPFTVNSIFTALIPLRWSLLPASAPF